MSADLEKRRAELARRIGEVVVEALEYAALFHSETHKPEPPLLTIKEACEYLSVSVKTIYRAIDRGELQAFKVGHALRLKVEDVDAYLKERNRERDEGFRLGDGR